MSGSDNNTDDPLKPGGVFDGPLFRGFLKRLSKVREPKPGERLGPWKIRHELGRGGTGVVFLAERADGAFNREVALKWLRGDRPSIGGFRVLERERELLASLDHPHIARLIDGGETDDGMLWFAMDLVSGEPIDCHCKKIELTGRISVMRRLCQALHHAHGRGLIHGDIKPSNVLVDSRGHPRLLDFGIARLNDGDGLGSYGLTPEYASPEQRNGQPLTTRSDVWQLGRLLKTASDKGAAPRDIRAIINRAMADEPDQRYDSAAAMEADLAAWQGRYPVSARGGGPVYRAGRLFVRNLALSVLALAAIAIIVSGGVWMAWKLAAERDLALAESSRTDQALSDAEEALARAEALRGFLVDLFRATEPDRPRDQLPATEELLDLGASQALDEAAAPGDERLGMLAVIGEVYMTLGQWDQAAPLLEAGAEIGRHNAGSRPEEVTRVLALKAHLARVRGELDRAEALLIEAEGASAGHDRAFGEFAHARTRRGSLAYMLGRNEEGLELLEPLYREVENPSRQVSPRTYLRLLETLGALHEATGNLEQSDRFRHRAVDQARELEGPESRSHAFHLSVLGAVQAKQGLFDLARQTLEEAAMLYDRIYDRPAVIHAGLIMNLAELDLLTGRYDRVPESLEAGLSMWADAHDRSFEEQTRANQHFARYLLHLDQPEQARPILERSMERLEASIGRDHPGALTTRAWLAQACCQSGEVARGLELVSGLDEPLGDSIPADFHEAQAVCLHMAGNHPDALSAIQRSLAEPVAPGHAMHKARRYRIKSEIQQAINHPDKADQAMKRAENVLANIGLTDHPVIRNPR